MKSLEEKQKIQKKNEKERKKEKKKSWPVSSFIVFLYSSFGLNSSIEIVANPKVPFIPSANSLERKKA